MMPFSFAPGISDKGLPVHSAIILSSRLRVDDKSLTGICVLKLRL